jgi:hypothetical protein
VNDDFSFVRKLSLFVDEKYFDKDHGCDLHAGLGLCSGQDWGRATAGTDLGLCCHMFRLISCSMCPWL